MASRTALDQLAAGSITFSRAAEMAGLSAGTLLNSPRSVISPGRRRSLDAISRHCDSWVVEAKPLIDLGKVRQLSLVEQVAEPCVLTERVCEEVDTTGPNGSIC